MAANEDTKVPDSRIGRRRQAANKANQKDYATKRAEIVRVAGEVFKDKGFEKTTLNDIAEKLGIDRASLYYYIGSKAELFREGVRGLADANISRGDEIYALDESATTKLELLAEHVLTSYDSSYPYGHIQLQENLHQIEGGEFGTHMAHQLRHLNSLTIRIINDGVESGEFRDDVPSYVAANAFWGMINWTHRWYQPGKDLTPAELADYFCSLFLEGLVAFD